MGLHAEKDQISSFNVYKLQLLMSAAFILEMF